MKDQYYIEHNIKLYRFNEQSNLEDEILEIINKMTTSGNK